MKKLLFITDSPRQKKIFTQLHLDVTVIPSNFEVKFNPRLKPKGHVISIAEGKTQLFVEKYKGEDMLLISTHTCITLGGEVILPPKTSEEVKHLLSRLGGKDHEVMTAITIIDAKTKKSVTKVAETKVTMKELTKKEIDTYAAHEEPLNSPGGYSMDGLGAAFVTNIHGDFYTILGLPLHILVEELKRFGVSIWH